MYVSVYDVGLFILFALALAVGGYLIAALRGIGHVAKQLSDIISENQDVIVTVRDVLPELLSNSNKTILSVLKTVDTAGLTVTSIEDNLSGTADKVQETLEIVLLYAHYASEVAKAVMGAFTKK